MFFQQYVNCTYDVGAITFSVLGDTVEFSQEIASLEALARKVIALAAPGNEPVFTVAVGTDAISEKEVSLLSACMSARCYAALWVLHGQKGSVTARAVATKSAIEKIEDVGKAWKRLDVPAHFKQSHQTQNAFSLFMSSAVEAEKFSIQKKLAELKRENEAELGAMLEEQPFADMRHWKTFVNEKSIKAEATRIYGRMQTHSATVSKFVSLHGAANKLEKELLEVSNTLNLKAPVDEKSAVLTLVGELFAVASFSQALNKKKQGETTKSMALFALRVPAILEPLSAPWQDVLYKCAQVARPKGEGPQSCV